MTAIYHCAKEQLTHLNGDQMLTPYCTLNIRHGIRHVDAGKYSLMSGPSYGFEVNKILESLTD